MGHDNQWLMAISMTDRACSLISIRLSTALVYFKDDLLRLHTVENFVTLHGIFERHDFVDHKSTRSRMSVKINALTIFAGSRRCDDSP